MFKSEKLANSKRTIYSESQLKKLLEKAVNLAKPDTDQLKLNEAQAIVQPFDQDFVCGLCSFVVCNPS